MSDPNLPNLDAATLTPVVRAMLESATAEVKSWQISPIIQGKASPAGVYRITGTAQAQDSTVPWSLVLKQIHAAAQSAHAGNNASDDPTSPWYWKREVLLFQSGLFDNLPDGFVTPHCYQIDEQPYASYIWMEDVREDVGAIWPLEHYAQVARHFGRFNGAYLAGEPIPTWPWLMKEASRQRVQGNEWPEFWANYPTLSHESALVQRGWSDELAHGVNRIWEDCEQFLQALAQLPQTLNHEDAGRKNLFARRRTDGNLETVVLDWGTASIGAVGEELSNIVSQPVYWFNGVRPEQVQELDKIAFDGYIQGLRDAGWQGDAALARLGYTASVALHSGLGIFIFEVSARDENTRIFIETAIGHSIEEIADTMRGFRSFVVACAEEARQLIRSLGIKSLR